MGLSPGCEGSNSRVGHGGRKLRNKAYVRVCVRLPKKLFFVAWGISYCF
jgi:hypothetical protein